MPARTEPLYSDLLDRALAFAANDFRRQARKGSGVPYLTHLLSVCALVGEYGGDEEQMAAAVLHDWLEDVEGATPERLSEEFSPRVSRLVVDLSDSVGVKEKAPWKERKDKYLAHLREAQTDTKLIACADKLHNATSIVLDHARVGDAIWDLFSVPREQTLWYYDSVVAALGTGWESELLERLDQTVKRLHTL